MAARTYDAGAFGLKVRLVLITRRKGTETTKGLGIRIVDVGTVGEA